MRPIRAGEPQGSTLSPLLYSAYVNDIPRPSTGVRLALFVDDTVIYLKSNSIGNILPRLQRANDELTRLLRLWRIDVNPDKKPRNVLLDPPDNLIVEVINPVGFPRLPESPLRSFRPGCKLHVPSYAEVPA
ncbi:RNA-directed DNA polymerase from mobile element jockey [Eumeta japonica]|uniref:RNA-directed DNA polymerase from mobile element jockey n=1 Tax=Eumeta variegata TaxID=151549 RepID=A0A4C1YD53_EUMVA|nr:RNA-directed DNA polymerase from mobile element jockey [Eumeta japonica]